MCQQIIHFCNGSAKALLLAGGLLSLLLAIAIGYTGCTTNALYADIDPEIASSKSLAYFLQLAAAGYLTLVTLFSCYAAYFDQKHSIRALALLTTLNFIVALVAITMIPSSADIGQLFQASLQRAATKYDFTDKTAVAQRMTLRNSLEKLELLHSSEGLAMNLTSANSSSRPTRMVTAADAAAEPPALAVQELNGTTATKLWDRLQARGCCGISNGTDEWKSKIPKSCCGQPLEEANETLCKQIDPDHQQGCLTLIGSTSLNLLIVLALIALVNFYLATISGVNAYRTFHYDEASQGAYS